jgi:hypothetical protein
LTGKYCFDPFSGGITMHRTIVMSTLLFLAFGSASDAIGELLFSDSFNTIANSWDVNYQCSSGGRQGGSLAPLTYTQRPAGTSDYHQVNNSKCPGTLMLKGGMISPNDAGSVSPDHNFTEIPGAGGYTDIQFDLYPCGPGTGASWSSWGAIMLGTTSGYRNIFVCDTDGIGLLFRGNGGFQAWGTYSLLNDSRYTTANFPGLHHIEIRIWDPSDGDPWNGIGVARIDAFADRDAIPFFSFTKAGGYAANYITLEGETDPGAPTAYHYFDNLTISTVPEPSTLVLSAVGLLVLGVRGRRKRRGAKGAV